MLGAGTLGIGQAPLPVRNPSNNATGSTNRNTSSPANSGGLRANVSDPGGGSSRPGGSSTYTAPSYSTPNYNSIWNTVQGLTQGSGAYDTTMLQQRLGELDGLRSYMGGGGGSGGGANADLINQETELRKQLLGLSDNDLNRQLGLGTEQLGHIGYLWDLTDQGYQSQDRVFGNQRTNTNQIADMDISDSQRNTNAQIESIMRSLGFDTSQLNAQTDYNVGSTTRDRDRTLGTLENTLSKGKFDENRTASNQLRAMLSDATTRGATLSRGYGQDTSDVKTNLMAQLGFLDTGAKLNRDFTNQQSAADIGELYRNRDATNQYRQQSADADTGLLRQNQDSSTQRTNLMRAYQLGLIDENQLQTGLQKSAEHNQAIQRIQTTTANNANIGDQLSANDIQRQLLDLSAQGALRGGGGGGSTNPANLLNLLGAQWGIQDQIAGTNRSQQQDAMNMYGFLANNPQALMALQQQLPTNNPTGVSNIPLDLLAQM